MRAAVYYGNSDVRIEERTKPKIGPKEILLKVEASGICGSDCLEWYRRDKVPLILGHEVSGVINDMGENVSGYRCGERIAVAHHVSCGRCFWCKHNHETVCETLRKTNFDPGGFCEYLRIPEINVEKGIFRLPGSVSFEEATFIEPLACVVRGQRLARFIPGQVVLVIGSGISGILHIQLAKARSKGLVFSTDINTYRLSAAKNFGADKVIDGNEDVPALLRNFNNGRLADLVVLCASAKSAVEQALRCVERGGTVLFFAAGGEKEIIPLSVNDIFWRNEVTLTSSYAAGYNDHVEALELIRRGKIKVKEMITHRLSLSEVQKGFRLTAEAGESLKVVINPQE